MSNSFVYLRNLMVLLFLAIAGCIAAQTTKHTVTGFVADKDGEPLWGATVTITNQGDSLNKRLAVVNEDGSFTVDSVPEGKNRLTITSIGYGDYARSITVNGDTNIGLTTMNMSAEMLDEITVMAEYTKVKNMGDIIVQVKGNPLAKDKLLTDFMRLIRELDVNEKDGIKVRGKRRTEIYLDDRPSSYERLKGISSSIIQRIEIIPFPDTSYGNGTVDAIVKVYLRKEAGLLGTVGVFGRSDDEGIKMVSPYNYILFSKGRWSISNSLQPTFYSRYTTRYDNYQETPDGNVKTSNDNVSRFKDVMDDISIRYSPNGLEYIDLFGTLVIGNSAKAYNTTSTGTTTGMTHLGQDNSGQAYKAGLQFKKMLKNDSITNLMFRAVYIKQKDKNNANYAVNDITEPARQKTNMDNLSVNPFVTFALSKKTTLAAGVLFHYSIDRHDDNGSPTLNYISDNKYDITTQNYQGYVDYSTLLGKSVIMQASLVYQGTKMKLKDYLDKSRNVEKWWNCVNPRLTAQWNIDQKKMRYLSVSLQQSYQLPDIGYLAPNVTWQYADRYSIGNPNLKKTTYYRANAYFSANRSWAVSYGFTYGTDFVNVIMHQDADNPNIYYTRPENTGHSVEHYASLTYSGNILKFWYSNNSLTGKYTKYKYDGRDIDCPGAKFNSYNDFSLNKWLRVSLYIDAQTKQKTINRETDASYRIDLGANASLLKGKLSAGVTCTGLLYNNPKTTISGDGWKYVQRNRFSGRELQFSIAWNFSAGKKINKMRLSKAGGVNRATPTF